MSRVLDARAVDVVLGEHQVLHGVDLHVDTGEVVALLGANGSGKSTLIRATVGLVTPTRGTVTLFDTPVARFRDWRRVGYVPQRSTAVGGVPASVREVVMTGRSSRRRPLLPASRADHAAVDQALTTVGLADRARDTFATLSGGQQQRVLIARAAAGEPDLLVLDEPTAGVDVPSQQSFADALERFVGQGHAVLVVLHELGPFAPLVTRTVHLDAGRLCTAPRHDVSTGADDPAHGSAALHHHSHGAHDDQDGIFG